MAAQSASCRKIKDGQLDERERYGLPQDVLMWVYGLGRPWTAKRFTDLDRRASSIQQLRLC